MRRAWRALAACAAAAMLGSCNGSRVLSEAPDSLTTCTNGFYGDPDHSQALAERSCQSRGSHAVKIGNGQCVNGWEAAWVCRP